MLKNLNKKRPLTRLIIFFVILVLIVGIPFKVIVDGMKDLGVKAKAIASAYQQQNFGQIQAQVKETHDALTRVDVSLNLLLWMKIIPVVGGYYGDIKSLTSAGIDDLEAVEKILADLKPHEEELGFLGKPITGPDRISQSLKVLEKSLPSFTKVEPNLKKAREKVEKIDVDKYPSQFRGINVKQVVQTAKNFMVGTHAAVTDAKDALEVTPTALGQQSPKNYLLLFQNDKEIRPTGGFITAYAFLKVDRGQVTTTTSDDIYRLDERLLATCESKICPLTPPPPIVKYLPEVSGKPRSAWSMRDSNISPDLPTAAQEFERMYLLLGQGTPFDGIIYIDSQVVEELIEVTGEVDIFGTPYSAKLDPRCNCPNVIYELESYAEVAAKGTQDRKAILGVLMSQILAKLVGADTEKVPQALETIIRLANHKHVMFYIHDRRTQNSLAKLNWIGEIKDFDGDYLHINDANFAGGKSNLYVEQKVTQEISVKGSEVRKKVIIEYKNSQPFGVWLNGINRDYVRFFVPKGSKLISSKGSEDGINTIEQLGKGVFEAFVTVRPQNSRKLEIEYTVPYNPKGEYKLLVQKQPGAKDFEYTIKINGSQKAKFKLDQDKEFKFEL